VTFRQEYGGQMGNLISVKLYSNRMCVGVDPDRKHFLWRRWYLRKAQSVQLMRRSFLKWNIVSKRTLKLIDKVKADIEGYFGIVLSNCSGSGSSLLKPIRDEDVRHVQTSYQWWIPFARDLWKRGNLPWSKWVLQVLDLDSYFAFSVKKLFNVQWAKNSKDILLAELQADKLDYYSSTLRWSLLGKYPKWFSDFII